MRRSYRRGLRLLGIESERRGCFDLELFKGAGPEPRSH